MILRGVASLVRKHHHLLVVALLGLYLIEWHENWVLGAVATGLLHKEIALEILPTHHLTLRNLEILLEVGLLIAALSLSVFSLAI